MMNAMASQVGLIRVGLLQDTIHNPIALEDIATAQLHELTGASRSSAQASSAAPPSSSGPS